MIFFLYLVTILNKRKKMIGEVSRYEKGEGKGGFRVILGFRVIFVGVRTRYEVILVFALLG